MELLGLVLIAVLFMATIAIVLVRFGAAVMRTSAQAKTDPTEPRLTDLRLLLQHNDPLSPLALQFKPITTVDPQFSSSEFVTWATDAFTRVSTYDGTTAATELPVTAAMAARLAQQAQMQESGGFTPVVKDVHLDTPWVEAVRVDPQQQAIDVRMSGTRVRYVASPDGKLFEGSPTPTRFAELATFVRPAGARSAAGADGAHLPPPVGLSHCPHCGAEVATGIAACPYCGTQLDQSSVPWLLDAITEAPAQTQPSAAGARLTTSASVGLFVRALGAGDHAPTTIALGKNLQAAVEQIHGRDPNFSQERFMRWATQTYLNERQRTNQAAVAIQKSDFLGVIISDTTEYAIVLISSLASGKKLTEAVVFSRPISSLTPPPPTAAPDTICSGCGAPLSAGASACAFCGTPIPDTEGAWKLEKIAAQGTDITTTSW